jgi:DNA-binding winged helix-turn-helix (wHTH) protein
MELGLIAENDGHVLLKGVTLKLAPKERAVLHLLIKSWPRVVAKASFAEQIWRGTMSDESLVRCIAKIRRALIRSDDIDLVAIYGQGYRLQVSPKISATTNTASAGHAVALLTVEVRPHIVAAVAHSRSLIHQRTNPALERAETLLRNILAEYPQCQTATLVFAECIAAQVSCGWALKRSSLEEAMLLLERVPKEARSTSGYYSSKAHLHDCAWEFDLASELHERALLFNPVSALTHYNYGWHLIACNNFEGAVAALKKASELAPFSPAISVMLARALKGNEQLDLGLAIMGRAVKDHPESSVAYIYLLAYEAYVSPTQEICAKALELSDKDLGWGIAPALVMYVLARCGEQARAQLIFDSYPGQNASIRATFAAPMLILGQEGKALELLSQAADLGCGFLPISLRMQETQVVSDHPLYQDIYRKVFARL